MRLDPALAPVTEEVTAFDLPVTGRLPAELRGRYLRIGPNALGVEDAAAHHWMRSEGMVHGVRLRDGRAEWYRNRWVRSDEVRRRLGEPELGIRPRVGADFSCNTHVIGHGGRVLTLTEGGAAPQELSYELDSIGPCSLGASGPGFTIPAHTKRDPRTGELHGVSYVVGLDHVRHTVLDAAGELTHVQDVEMGGSVMVHDLALTERYVVVYDSPITFRPEAQRAGAAVPFAWDDRRPTRVGLLPRAGGGVRWFEVSPCFASHTLNAYDDGPRVVVELVTFPERFDIGRLTADRYGALVRWTVDPAAGTVREEGLDDHPQDFPRVSDSVVSRRHRYGYLAATAAMFRAYVPLDGPVPDGAFDNALIKHDLARGSREIHRFASDAAVGEAVFVPAESATAEDDGYVLAYVHDPDRGAADLVVLAAQDFTAEPLARVHLPRRIPLGLHGSWLPD